MSFLSMCPTRNRKSPTGQVQLHTYNLPRRIQKAEVFTEPPTLQRRPRQAPPPRCPQTPGRRLPRSEARSLLDGWHSGSLLASPHSPGSAPHSNHKAPSASGGRHRGLVAGAWTPLERDLQPGVPG